MSGVDDIEDALAQELEQMEAHEAEELIRETEAQNRLQQAALSTAPTRNLLDEDDEIEEEIVPSKTKKSSIPAHRIVNKPVEEVEVE
eukprot:CAMPEP_0198212322 /NCGR_PEP_ID=MMETSP1445-20131203/25652_1 /TAXON_ID=36898 /ORGANISM="Pyramimonas sp., Strain CCMP2087" /LENGTH=86 /DNA_ID=CAMNT_0043886741 /DNA_START=118 /DNA_END=375 /DNA_ORIENTATION=+